MSGFKFTPKPQEPEEDRKTRVEKTADNDKANTYVLKCFAYRSLIIDMCMEIYDFLDEDETYHVPGIKRWRNMLNKHVLSAIFNDRRFFEDHGYASDEERKTDIDRTRMANGILIEHLLPYINGISDAFDEWAKKGGCKDAPVVSTIETTLHMCKYFDRSIHHLHELVIQETQMSLSAITDMRWFTLIVNTMKSLRDEIYKKLRWSAPLEESAAELYARVKEQTENLDEFVRVDFCPLCDKAFDAVPASDNRRCSETKVEDLPFGWRTRKLLDEHGIVWMRQLLKLHKHEVLGWKGLGPKTAQDLLGVIASKWPGLQWK